MEILKRCLLCEKKGMVTLQLVNDSGWIEWRKNDSIAIEIAIEQKPSDYLASDINYIPAVLACDTCGKLPSNFCGF